MISLHNLFTSKYFLAEPHNQAWKICAVRISKTNRMKKKDFTGELLHPWKAICISGVFFL